MKHYTPLFNQQNPSGALPEQIQELEDFRPSATCVAAWRAKSPTVQLKSFAPFFWVGGGRVCVWYMSWGFRQVRLGFGVLRAHFGSPEASLRAFFGQN